MRVRRSPRLALTRFWSNLESKIRDRWWIARFSLALGALLALLAAAGLAYHLRLHEYIALRVQGWLSGSQSRPNDLPTLHFDIAFDPYRELAMGRQRALRAGILQPGDAKWVAARMRFEGETIPVHIRLGGSEADGAPPADHWQTNKWSLEVEVQEGATLLGMRSVSLRSPATSHYLDGWLYVEDLRRAGILAPRYAFVNLSLNGDDWGVYALQEGFSEELLESQGRTQGAIVRLDESLLGGRGVPGSDRGAGRMALGDPSAEAFELPAFARVVELDAGGSKDGASLSEQALAALRLLREFQSQQLAAAQAFDADLMGRYLAHADLWGAREGVAGHGARYYYNPSTARLEPVACGGAPLAAVDRPLMGLGQYDDLAIAEAYVREATRISQPGYLEELQGAYQRAFKRHYAALAQEFFPAYLGAPWDALAERQAALSATLHPPQTVYAFRSGGYHGGGEHPSTLDVQVGNLSPYPVALRQVRAGERAVEIQPAWADETEGADAGSDALLHREVWPVLVLRPLRGDVPRYITLRIPADALGSPAEGARLQLVTELVGMEERVVVEVLPGDPSPLSGSSLPAQPSVEDALARHPFLKVTERLGFLGLRPGTWHVQGDLVLPDGVGLWASEPVTLTFDRGAVLFASGPLVLHGPQGEGIHLLPEEDHWAGLVVLGAGPQQSSLYNVEIRATRGLRRGGWATSGGVTFHGSPAVLYHCCLLDSYAPDAIHVVRSSFAFVGTEFGVASGDALDGDYSQGRIERCAFHDVLGNAVDLTASDVVLQDVSLLRIYGEALSAGRGSALSAQGVRAAEVGIAVASVDASSVRVQDVRVAQAQTAGFAAYLEELAYGPARIEATQVTFEDDSPQALVQEGSQATINGLAAAPRATSADELRRQKATPPPMRPLNVRFGPAIWLVGYHLTTPQLAPGDTVEVILYWRTFAPLDRQYTVFVHLLDASGEWVAGWDMMPRYNTYPTTDWPIVELIDDVRILPLAQDLPAGEYRVALGMYYWGTGERLPAYTHEGVEIPQSTVVLEEMVVVK